MPKLLFDQNLSYRLVKQLEQLFPGSSHVRLLNLEEADDLAVWHYAKEHSFQIVSKDADFNNLNALYGYPPKIIWIHSGNKSTQEIIEFFRNKSEAILAFLENEETGLLELT